MKVAEGADDLVTRSRWWILPLAAALMAVMAWSMQQQRGSAPSKQLTEKSSMALAVLPFRTLNGEASDPLLELGLADTLIARLSRYEQLSVRSLTSARAAVGPEMDPLAAGVRLQADYVVDGSAQRFGDRVRVNVHLVNMQTGASVWASSFDETIEKVFHLQDDIVDSVSDALGLKGEKLAVASPSPCEGENLEAYRALLVGRHITYGPPTTMRLPNSLDAYRRALDLDPTCASAYAGMAMIFRAESIAGSRDPREMMPLSFSAAEQALAAGQEDAALKSLQRSIALAPDYLLNHYVRGGMMLDRGEPLAAVADLEIAARQSSDNCHVLGLLVMAYAAAGKIKDAQTVLDNLTQRADEEYVPPSALAAAFLGIGDTDKAFDLLERAYDERDARVAYLGIDARWNALREHPRFRELLKKLGFSAGMGRARF